MREPKIETKGKYYRVRYYKDAFAKNRSEKWFSDKKKVDVFLSELNNTPDQQNQNIQNKGVRVGEFFNTYKNTTKHDLKFTSRDVVYRNLNRRFIEKNKYLTLKEVCKKERLEKIKNDIFEMGLSEGVINATFYYINDFFNVALDYDKINDKDIRIVKSTFKPIKNRHKNKHKDEVGWTIDQSKYFLKCLENEHNYWYPFFYFQISFGLRQSELSGLCLKHIDTNNKTITIEQQAINNPETHAIEISDLKTANSVRVIKYNDEQNEIIKEYIRTIRLTDPNKFFFFNKDKPLSKTSINHNFEIYRAKFGMPYASIHTLRHNAITYILQQPNLSPAQLGEIARRFGHTEQTMINTYMRIHPNSSKEVIDFSIFKGEPKKVYN